MYQVESSKTEKCLLCTGKKGDKQQPVFVVKGPAFAGEVCADHLRILVERNGQKQ